MNKRKVLIVDDELINLNLMKTIVNMNMPNYEVISANDGTEGVDLFLKNKNQLSLVITDFQMPKMNGGEFCTIIRRDEIGNKIPVLLFSGMAKREIKNKEIFNGVFAKPGDFMELALRGNQLILEYEKKNITN